MAVPRNDKQLGDFVREKCKAFETPRRDLFRQIHIDACYAEGCQWIMDQDPRRSINSASTAVSRWFSRYDPSDPELRVTANEITRLIQMVEASTSPTNIEIGAEPPEFDLTADAQNSADIAERSTNAVLDEIGYTDNSRRANHARTIAGTWGIGVGLRASSAQMDDEEVADSQMVAFDFDPSMLTLDPANPSGELCRHDFVIYSDTWTVGKMERMFPGELKKRDIGDEDLKTIGELEPFKETMYSLSGGRLFADHHKYSKTKGVVVHQVHIKQPNGRFTMQHFIEAGEEEGFSPDIEDPESPFGGDGLPLMLIQGHPRFKSPFGISDVRMLKEDQDKNNLGETLFYRIMQKSSGSTILVDQRWFSSRMDEQSVRDKFTNRVHRVIVGNPRGSREQGISEPQFVEQRAIDMGLMEHADRQTDRMRLKVHRAPGHEGQVKSHVPATVNDRNLDEADAVHDKRIRSDVIAHERFIYNIILGTLVKLLQGRTPWAAGLLRRHGMEAEDLGRLASLDARNPQVRVILRESAIRRRSYRAKQADLQFAVTTGAIDGLTYQRIMAQTLDTPLDDEMADMARKARQAVIRIRAGEEWVAVPLGMYTDLFLNEFRRATQDRNVRRDPEALERFLEAIENQTVMATQEAMMADPKIAFDMQQAQNGVQSSAEQTAPEQLDLAALAASLDGVGTAPSSSANPPLLPA